MPVAIGTDFNPGTSPVPSLPLAMSVAMLRLGLTPAEVLAATTVNAAAALGLADRGSLEPGRRADLVVWDVPTHAQLPYWAGADLVRWSSAGGEAVGLGGRSSAPGPTRAASLTRERTLLDLAAGLQHARSSSRQGRCSE